MPLSGHARISKQLASAGESNVEISEYAQDKTEREAAEREAAERMQLALRERERAQREAARVREDDKRPGSTKIEQSSGRMPKQHGKMPNVSSSRWLSRKLLTDKMLSSVRKLRLPEQGYSASPVCRWSPHRYRQQQACQRTEETLARLRQINRVTT